MRHLAAGFWWILVLRGILGVILGLETLWLMTAMEWQSENPLDLFNFMKPAIVFSGLILSLGLYAFMDGFFAVLLGFQDYGHGRRWWTLVLEGFLSMGLGFMVWRRPETALFVLLYWIAAWALLTGLMEMNLGIRGTEYRDRWGPFFYGGLCSVLFGLLIFFPGVRGAAFAWLIGIYSLLFSVPLLVLGFRMRRFSSPRP